MIFFIDCEFDGFKGDLISFAMVPLVSGVASPIYGVFKDHASDEWVKTNVIPLLHKNIPVALLRDKKEVAGAIASVFSNFEHVEVIADWPADIKHFCDLIEFNGGECYPMQNIKFMIDWELSSKDSKVPHNAFYDALAIAESYKSTRT